MASGSLWRSARPLIAGRAVSAVIGVALPAVLARALDQTSYGTYKQVYLIANLALGSLQLGLAQSLFYFVPRAQTEEERRGYLAQTQTLLAMIGLLTFAGLHFFGPQLAAKFSNPQLADLSLPLAVLAGALVASAPFEIALTSRGKPQWSAFALIGTDLVRVTAMLSAILLGYGVRGLVWAAALAACVRWIASLFIVGGLQKPSFSADTLKRQFAYSLPFGAAVLLLQQQQQLHQVFVSARATPDLFALYAVGCMQIPVVSLLYTPVSETLQVRLAALERTGETHLSGKVFAEAVDKLAMIFLPLCALLIATARPGIEILYGARYATAAQVMRIAVVSVAVASLPVDGVLKARAKTPTLLWIYGVKLAVTWPAVAFGWKVGGMEGVIAAHVAVETLTKISQLAIIAADLKVPAIELLGGKPMMRSFFAAAAGGVLGSIASAAIHQPLVACFVAGVATVSFSAADYLMRRRRAHVPTPRDSLSRAA